MPPSSCINHAIIINVHSERLYHPMPQSVTKPADCNELAKQAQISHGAASYCGEEAWSCRRSAPKLDPETEMWVNQDELDFVTLYVQSFTPTGWKNMFLLISSLTVLKLFLYQMQCVYINDNLTFIGLLRVQGTLSCCIKPHCEQIVNPEISCVEH